MATLRDIITAAGYSPIPCMSGRPHIEAAVQSAMAGLTHFYDAGSMAFFSCKVRKARALDDGAILGTVCTQAAGFHGGRVYVVNFHDFAGNFIGGADLDERSFPTMKAAEKYFWAKAETFNGADVVREALRGERDAANRKARTINAALRKYARKLQGAKA